MLAAGQGVVDHLPAFFLRTFKRFDLPAINYAVAVMLQASCEDFY